MHPILNIQQVRKDRFTYSVATTQPAPLGAGDYFFESVERCLRDAGEALHAYFDDVFICFANVPLGVHPVERLLKEPRILLDELAQRWMEAHRSRACGKP
jgi:hypothetical protein